MVDANRIAKMYEELGTHEQMIVMIFVKILDLNQDFRRYFSEEVASIIREGEKQ